MERESATRKTRERGAPEIVPPDIGLDAAGRAQTFPSLKWRLYRSPDQLELVDLFVRGLGNDFSPDQAEITRTCRCGRPGENILCVSWSGRVDASATASGWTLAPLFSRKAQWVDLHIDTYHATCSGCARKRSWLDRFERFFGKIPSLLRVSKVERLPFSTPAGAASTRGTDLRYDITITAAEETAGFKRMLHFPRQADVLSGDHTTSTIAEAAEEVSVGSGWTAGQLRRTQGDFHYALRLRGSGNRGIPAGNNGDLFVTVTVQD